jgi:hypothetical protein
MDINRNPYYIQNVNADALEEKYKKMLQEQQRSQGSGMNLSAGNVANIAGGALATTAATMDAINSYRDIARARPDKMINPYTSIRYGDDPGEFQKQDNPFKQGEGFRQGIGDAGKLAGSGGALGAAIGTAVLPGVGTAIGGAIGAGAGLVGGVVSGISKGQANARQRRRFNSFQEKARENFDYSKDAFNENQRNLDLSSAQNNYKNLQSNFLSE